MRRTTSWTVGGMGSIPTVATSSLAITTVRFATVGGD
jgi:hypothetical protein